MPRAIDRVRAGLVAVLVAGAAVASTVAPASAVTGDWRSRMLSRVNAVRALAGVPAVTPCPALTASAQRYAALLARTDTFGHIGPDGRGPGERITSAGYRWTLAGENLAGGQQAVHEAMQGWRASASHLATMTNRAYTHVGFGHVSDPGSAYGRYWVQDYAAGRC
jgi:uncharacterized protein YkwD